jgi:hypothetical protein
MLAITCIALHTSFVTCDYRPGQVLAKLLCCRSSQLLCFALLRNPTTFNCPLFVQYYWIAYCVRLRCTNPSCSLTRRKPIQHHDSTVSFLTQGTGSCCAAASQLPSRLCNVQDRAFTQRRGLFLSEIFIASYRARVARPLVIVCDNSCSVACRTRASACACGLRHRCRCGCGSTSIFLALRTNVPVRRVQACTRSFRSKCCSGVNVVC